MKKFTIFLLISLMFVLAACGNQGDGSKGKDSSSKGDKETVTIHNQFEARGDKKDGSDAKKVDDKVSVPKNPKRAVVLDYGALDTIKELGLADKVKGLPKGEGGKSLPDFLKNLKMTNTSTRVTLKKSTSIKLLKLNRMSSIFLDVQLHNKT